MWGSSVNSSFRLYPHRSSICHSTPRTGKHSAPDPARSAQRERRNRAVNHPRYPGDGAERSRRRPTAAKRFAHQLMTHEITGGGRAPNGPRPRDPARRRLVLLAAFAQGRRHFPASRETQQHDPAKMADVVTSRDRTVRSRRGLMHAGARSKLQSCEKHRMRKSMM